MRNNIELPSAETIQAAQVEPLFYDINQAAQALNVSTKSVRRLLRVRKLTSCKALRKVLIPRKQIEEFECGINEQMAVRLPAAKSFLTSVNRRVYDLMDIFSKQFYVHKGFKGGTSIKDVLPVLVPELSYADLAIHEGGTASQMWDRITSAGMNVAEKEKTARDLKLYCERDTFAMVAIWEFLQKLTVV